MRQEVIHVHLDMLVAGYYPLLFRKVCSDRVEGRIVCASLDEHADYRQGARCRLVHEMHLHRVIHTFDGVLARTMEVELDELVGGVSDGEGIAF